MANVDANGRPEYPPAIDWQPRLDEKREDLEARLRTMEEAAGPIISTEPRDVTTKARAVNDRLRPKASKAK